MTGPEIFFNEVNERQGVFHRRAFMLGGVAAVGIVALSARLADLQLLQAGRYQTMSEHNQFDFRLRKDSPALARGFKPIDLTTVGVRPPEKRSDN